MADEPKTEPLFAVTSSEQYRTAEELIEKSRPHSSYYTLLGISSIIIAAGLLLDNAPIVIGGMLVAPVLTPLLAIALGLALGEAKIMKDTGLLLLKSLAIVVGCSLLMAVVIGAGKETLVFENSMRTAILYFIIAVASGLAATLAWVKKELSEALPGIAIAVSLVPPLALIGIRLSELNLDAARFYFSVFLLNLFGIVIGSLAIFLLLKFYKAGDRIHKKIIGG